MRSVILHNPGCGDPNKLCSPHPPDLVETTLYMMSHPFETLGMMAAILSVAFIIAGFRRYAERRDDG